METAPVAPSPEEERSHIGPVGRLFGVFWEPKQTFEDIASRPGWWLPLLLLAVLGVVYVYGLINTVGLETLLRQQLESQSRLQQLSAAQREQIIAAQIGYLPYVYYASAVILGPAFYLLIALVLMYTFRVTAGSQANFKQALGITTHAFLPRAISSILAIIVMQLVHPQDFDPQNPLMSNLGWLVGESGPAWLRSLAGSIDLFVFWIMILLAMGFAATARKLRTGRAFTTILALYLVVVVLRVGWAALVG